MKKLYFLLCYFLLTFLFVPSIFACNFQCDPSYGGYCSSTSDPGGQYNQYTTDPTYTSELCSGCYINNFSSPKKYLRVGCVCAEPPLSPWFQFKPAPGENGGLPPCNSEVIRRCYDAAGNIVYFEVRDCNGTVHAYGDMSLSVGDCVYTPTGGDLMSPGDVDVEITDLATGWEMPKVEPEPSPWWEVTSPLDRPWQYPPLGDLDGDGIANAYDDDIDGDGIGNALDDDNDNDGILDNNDIAPYNSEDQGWRDYKRFYSDGWSEGADPDGGVIETGEGDVIVWGDISGEEERVVHGGNVFNPDSTLPYDLGGGGGGGGSGSGDPPARPAEPEESPPPSEPYKPEPSGEPEIIPEAENNEGNIDDLNFLEDIVTNTGSNVTALKEVAKFLEGIESDQKLFGDMNIKNLQALGDKLDNINTGVGGGDGLTQSDVESALAADRVAGNIAAETARSQAEAALDVSGEPTYLPYDESDIPDYSQDQTDYETELNNLSNNSSISNVRDNLGIQTSAPTSSVNCHLCGQIITFDFSPHASLLQNIGSMWVSLCYLSGFLIIMRS